MRGGGEHLVLPVVLEVVFVEVVAGDHAHDLQSSTTARCRMPMVLNSLLGMGVGTGR